MPLAENPKIVLITGTSSGFGLLTAARLAASGHFVYASMRNLSKQGDLLLEIKQRGAQLRVKELDVTKIDTIRKVVAEIYTDHQRIDVLINNAGFGLGGFFEDLTQDQIRDQMEVNFFGVQNVCREVIPLMRKQKYGKIINISSIAGQTASPALGAYAASKWALEGFSESLYHEMALFNVQVVLVEPGSYPTKIFLENSRYSEEFDNAQSPYYLLSQKLRTFVQKEMAKNKKDPEDVAILIEKVVQAKNPKLRYVSDFKSWLRILAGRTMPPALYNSIFRKVIYGNSKYSL